MPTIWAVSMNSHILFINRSYEVFWSTQLSGFLLEFECMFVIPKPVNRDLIWFRSVFQKTLITKATLTVVYIKKGIFPLESPKYHKH